MEKGKKNPVNRCFGNYPKNPKKSDKPKPPPLADQQKDEEVKRILLEANQKKNAEREMSSLLKQFGGRYSVLDLLGLIRCRFPWLLDFAIEKVERQKRRNVLSLNQIVEFEQFKLSLKEEKKPTM
jgi:hypothetical protein